MKTILIVLCCWSLSGFGQQRSWHTKDFLSDSVYGISLDKAYRELLYNKKPDTIIVAVLDNGIDSLHEDLQPVLWKQVKERGNDEDGNGYKGDFHGWNFLGGANGANLVNAGYEYQRLYTALKQHYAEMTANGLARKKEYPVWLEVSNKVMKDSVQRVSSLTAYSARIVASDSIVRKTLGRETYSYTDIKAWKPAQREVRDAVAYLTPHFHKLPAESNGVILAQLKRSYDSLMHSAPADYLHKRWTTIGDTYDAPDDKYYGNNDLACGQSCMHGTHVAGIIGAARDNNKGMDGIAAAVKIMVLRVVPLTGDEYDKDVALAIRYAVDNGARVINMSFSKPYSPGRQWVEKAIQYAAEKDVVIVKGAGNDAVNIDLAPVYPTSWYTNGKKKAPNMIIAGASGPTREYLVASFSNYGNKTVDVFAPGLNIYSTVTGNSYAEMSGTSMATPVVAGLAALLRSYYPQLSAKQVKYIIESTIYKINEPVVQPGTGKKIPMSQLCRSGGIVNAYNAIQLADRLVKKNNRERY